MAILTTKNAIKEYIKLLYTCPQYKKILDGLRKSRNSKIVLFGTPAHGNLGDQAIAISELAYLHDISNGREVIEIPMPLYKTHRWLLHKYIGNNDTIIISGGGWMGNLWIHNEITIREIVTDYKDNRIIIFPQTLYYTNDEAGRRTAIETKNIFEKHNDLILAVRDSNSFEYAKINLGFTKKDKLLFCPDMAIYGTLASVETLLTDKKVALLCLRNDIEKASNTSYVRKTLEDAGYEIIETTTVLKKLIPICKREQVVKDKIKEFAEASIVVTDRLHAMIFALLSGTPCFAFDNATGKVFGVGQYLKNSGLPVYLIDRIEVPMLENVDTKKGEYYLADELKGYFQRLGEVINLKPKGAKSSR